jgi:hypothetical protein
MVVHRIPRLIRGRRAAGPRRSFGARRHMDKKPVSTELTPIPHSSSDSPQQRTVPRKSVAFGYYVTICVRNASQAAPFGCGGPETAGRGSADLAVKYSWPAQGPTCRNSLNMLHCTPLRNGYRNARKTITL